jgi:flagellar protein FlbD
MVPAQSTSQGWTVVILVTRLNGPAFALNPDLVERADSTPDTVITLVDGTKYVVSESVPEFIDLVREYRASVIADAHHMVDLPQDTPHRPARIVEADGTANVLQLHPRER